MTDEELKKILFMLFVARNKETDNQEIERYNEAIKSIHRHFGIV